MGRDNNVNLGAGVEDPEPDPGEHRAGPKCTPREGATKMNHAVFPLGVYLLIWTPGPRGIGSMRERDIKDFEGLDVLVRSVAAKFDSAEVEVGVVSSHLSVLSGLEPKGSSFRADNGAQQFALRSR